jgi:hypothetical protein
MDFGDRVRFGMVVPDDPEEPYQRIRTYRKRLVPMRKRITWQWVEVCKWPTVYDQETHWEDEGDPSGGDIPF